MNTSTGSDVVKALENVWEEIRKRHPELPEVVIITGSGNMGLGLKWGHFADRAWLNGRFIVDSQGNAEKDRRPEMFISGERLGVGATETVQTMLHEAVHALAAVRGIKDTSRQNRYHNRRFLELAREVGLDYPHEKPHTAIGFSAVEITEETKEEYGDVIDALSEAIRLTIDLPGWASLLGGLGTGNGDGLSGRAVVDPEPKKKGGLLKATCGCGRNIRVALSVFEQASIDCGECGEPFALQD